MKRFSALVTPSIESTFQDVRYALRLFAKRPGFTTVALLTLALGVGANTAIFSLARAVLLRPLPYEQPDRLVHVWLERATPVDHSRHGILTGKHLIEWERRSTSFESFAVIESWDHNLGPRMDLFNPHGAERLRGAFVTSNFFELLGVRAAQGRTFDSEDALRGDNLLVLSDGLWRRRFGADRAIVGSPLDLIAGHRNRAAVRYRVIGVLPAGFRFTYPEETEAWTILPWSQIRPSFALSYQFVARLKNGVEPATAQAELTTMAQDVARAARRPEKYVRDTVALVETMPEHLTAAVRPGVLLLVAAAGVVMLIATVNVALLLLALMVARTREISLRTATGATRSRIARQLLVESGMLALAGAVLGVILASVLMPAFRAVVPPMLPRGEEMALDPAVLTFAIIVTVVTAILCGLIPAWHVHRRGLEVSLRQVSSAATGTPGIIVWRRVVVAAQMAVVLVLLVTASLLLHSFWRLQRVDLGFSGEGLVTMEMRLLNPKYRQQPGRRAEFQRAVMERVRALPGVQQASMTSAVPFRGVDFLSVIGLKGERGKGAYRRPVDPEYFALMRIPILAGRGFTAADDANSTPVVVVSRAYARALFGDASPLGRPLDFGDKEAEIVGMVGDVRHEDVTRAPAPALYLPRAQEPNELMCLVVRPAPGAQGVAAAVRATVTAIDPEQPVERVTTLDRIVRENTAEERFYTVMTVSFGAVAVLLALAGLAGVVSRSVTERVREIAIRIALGAEPSRVVRQTVREGLYPVAFGLGAGLLGAWVTARMLQRFLFEVSPVDPLTYSVAIVLLAAAATAACYVPARRATRVEPMLALKEE